MSDRVILAVKYTSASSPASVRKAVGAFLRYVQYRDKHPDSMPPDPRVSGLLKYVAFRDKARQDGRLFGPNGSIGDLERREFAAFVARSVAATQPQIARNGSEPTDRRKAVYRFVLSPERAEGLDLRQLTRAAISRLEREGKVSGLRWLAAEHRNTAHPHVHIVLAGMREVDDGYRGYAITRQRLAAMKEELVLEISRQRAARQADLAPEPGLIEGVRLEVRKVDRTLRRPSTHKRTAVWRVRSFTLLASGSTISRLQRAARRYRARLDYEAELDRLRRERER